MTKRTALARARRGAAFLDEKLGRGWRRRVAKTRLNMQRGYFTVEDRNRCGCILAQLAPEVGGQKLYVRGAEQIGIDPWGNDAVRLGFYTEEENDAAAYADLTDAWLRVLAE